MGTPLVLGKKLIMQFGKRFLGLLMLSLASVHGFKLTIKSVFGNAEVEPEPTMLISELKAKLHVLYKMKIRDNQRLRTRSGEFLDDDTRTLKQYKITADSTLFSVVCTPESSLRRKAAFEKAALEAKNKKGCLVMRRRLLTGQR